jgi:DNA repair protein RecO (recombination protein O)
VCAVCRPSSVAMPARETVLLLAALLSGQWEVADASGASERNEADRLVAGYLRWHLERQLRSLPLLDTWRDPTLLPAAGLTGA